MNGDSVVRAKEEKSDESDDDSMLNRPTFSPKSNGLIEAPSVAQNGPPQ